MAQKFQIVFDASMNVSQVKNAVGEMQTALSKLTLSQNLTSRFTSLIENLSKEIENFESFNGKEIGNKADFTKFEKSGEKILDLYKQITVQAKNLLGFSNDDIKKLFPSEIANNIRDANKALKQYNESQEKNNKIRNDSNKELLRQTSLLGKAKDNLSKNEGKRRVSDNEYKAIADNLKSIQNEYKQVGTELDTAKEKLKKYKEENPEPTKGRQSYITKLEKEIKDITTRYNELREAKKKATQEKDSVVKETDMKKYSEQITTATEQITRLKNLLKTLPNDQVTLEQLFAKLKAPASSIGIDVDKIEHTKESAENLIMALEKANTDKIRQGFEALGITVNNLSPDMQHLRQELDKNSDAFKQFDEAARDVESLKQRITYFFGLNNAINLARRALQNAFNTIKELDAAMTETAVVTDFSIGDMWEQLPRYTEAANKLGTTTLGAYQTMTLFYQQGLNTNEAFEIGTETMKMARIANLDYTKSTDLMTAALRGFNMELNETSATRVNDVYSELAAITAADTEEIATAMTKTASIANSANMEFETTAAFLSQIINITVTCNSNVA